MKIGDIVKYNGQRMKITRFDENGGAELEPVQDELKADMSESGAGFFERAEAGLAPEDPESQFKAWQNIRGDENVRRDENGSILVLDGTTWRPVEEDGITLGDLADYSGELLEDIGQTIGAGVGAAKGLLSGPFASIMVPLGIGAGSMAGEAAGSTFREAVGRYFGVIDDDAMQSVKRVAGDTAMALPEAALGGAVGKGIARVGKPVVKSVLKSIDTPLQTLGKARDTGLQLVSGVSKPAIEAMKRDPDKLMAIRANPTKAVDEAVDSLIVKTGANRKAAGAALGEFTEQILTPDDKIDPLIVGPKIMDVLHKYEIPLDGPAKYSKIQNKKERELLQTWAQDAIGAPNVLDLKNLREGMDSYIFDHGAKGSARFEAAKKAIRAHAEQEIEAVVATKGDDAFDAYKLLKKAYGTAANEEKQVTSYFQILADEALDGGKIEAAKRARGLGTVRNLQGEANRAHLEAFESLAKRNPELAPDVDTLLTSQAAVEWGSMLQPNKMDVGRLGAEVGGAIAAGVNPVVAGTAYVATRPKVLAKNVARSVKAGRKIGELRKIGEEALPETISRARTGLAKIGEDSLDFGSKISGLEVAKSLLPSIGQTGPNTLPAVGEIRPMSSADDVRHKAAAIGRDQYSANYKRNLESGLDDDQAAIDALKLSKPKKRDDLLKRVFSDEISKYKSAGEPDGLNKIKSILGTK